MDRHSIARALQGFGAGYRGKGQEFLKQLDNDRKSAMMQDALQVETKIKSGDVAGARDLLLNRMENLERLGGDSSDTQELLGKIDNGDIAGALNDAGTVVEFGYQSGFLKRPEAPKVKSQIVGNQVVSIDAQGNAIASPITGLTMDALDDSPSVKSSEILPDGTTVQVMTNGKTRVTSPDGSELKGKDRVVAIKDARKYGAEVQGQRATERTLGTDPIQASIKLGTQAFDKIDGVRKNISNLGQVVDAIDKGANTGSVAKFFPSVQAASIELDNLRNRLGLDVIGDVTFGALSKGELDLALDTALPTKLNEQELRQWALEKQAAQKAYVKELEKAASFFSRGGSISDYINIRRDQPATQTQANTGQTKAISVDY